MPGAPGNTPQDMNRPFITIKDLHYRYPDGTAALKGVSVDIDEGEALAVIGGNGAGKSTLLLHLNGTLPPAGGTVEVGGIHVTPDSAAQVRRLVGMVFQNPDDQLFMPTVSEDVSFGPLHMGLEADETGERVRRALEQVGAWDVRDKPPHHLSGGEKRAVSIAGILAMDPVVLVMDEPGSALDPWARRNLIGLLNGLTYTRIIATHDLDLALDVCPRSLILRNGEVAACGDTRALLSDGELLASCRLEQPWRLRA